MKIRTGFVSNSSSSSFIALITKTAYENLCKQLNPLELAVLLELGVSDAKFLGRECVFYECSHGNHTFLDYVNINDIVASATDIAIARKDNIADYIIERADYSIKGAEQNVERQISRLIETGEAFIYSFDY